MVTAATLTSEETRGHRGSGYNAPIHYFEAGTNVAPDADLIVL
jgi:hypothetical protein